MASAVPEVTDWQETITLRLRDGRRLAWAGYGDPDRPTVLFLHGTPGGRRTVGQYADGFARRGLHVIAPDRPGYGRSDPHPGRTLLDTADDLAELLHTLGLEQAVVVGGSAGGAYALALAATAPDLVRSVGVVVGAAPLTPEEIAVLASPTGTVINQLQHPTRLREVLGQVRRTLLDQGMAGLADSAPEPDRVRWVEQAQDLQRAAIDDALEPGTQGMAEDFQAVFGQPWPFALDAVMAPVVWGHGDEDHNVPLPAARRVADELPRCEFIVWPGIGHAPGPERMDSIVSAAVAAAGS